MNNLLNLIIILLLNTSISWIRMFIALAISIIFSLFIGIIAARSKAAEKIILPILDIFQTLPILAFFPFVIIIILGLIKGGIGLNIAVIFLIITSMVWNISFAVYEAIKVLPNEFLELSKIYNLNFIQRFKKIYLPSAMPRVIEQSILSWSIGLFYLITSEIFSTGTVNYKVKYGIGVELMKLGYSNNFLYYLIGILVLIIFVVLTRLLFFIPLENYFNKFNKQNNQEPKLARLYNLFKAPFFITSNTIKFSLHKINKTKKQKNKTLIHKLKIQKQILIKNSQSNTILNKFNFKIELEPKILKAIFVIFFILIIFVHILYPKFLSELFYYEYISLISLFYTFIRVWTVFLIIIAITIPLSIYLIFISKNSNKFLLVFQVLASIPATILLPIIVLYFKNNGNMVAFFIFFISGIWYVLFSIIASSKNIEKHISEVKSIFHVRGFLAFKKIYLKAIIPGLITGAVTGIAAEWNASIVAEYFTKTGISGAHAITQVNIGIGKLLDTTLSSGPHGNLLLMLIALINLTVMIILINTFLWKKYYKKISDIYT